jgi:hypothetical protein
MKKIVYLVSVAMISLFLTVGTVSAQDVKGTTPKTEQTTPKKVTKSKKAACCKEKGKKEGCCASKEKKDGCCANKGKKEGCNKSDSTATHKCQGNKDGHKCSKH